MQNYNHPSICFWGISNEIMMGEESDELVENQRILQKLCHKLDPSRKTVLANLTTVESQSEQNKITDLSAYNVYMGWYAGKVEDCGAWMDSLHKEMAQIPMFNIIRMLRNVRIIRKSTSLIITKKCFRQYRNDRISGAALCGICSILRQIREKKVAHKGVIQKVWLHMIGKLKRMHFIFIKHIGQKNRLCTSVQSVFKKDRETLQQ